MDTHFQPRRRQVVMGLAAAGLAGVGAPAIGQQRTQIKMGYVDTLAVTGQLFTGMHRGHWAKENLEFEPVKFKGVKLPGLRKSIALNFSTPAASNTRARTQAYSSREKPSLFIASI